MEQLWGAVGFLCQPSSARKEPLRSFLLRPFFHPSKGTRAVLSSFDSSGADSGLSRSCFPATLFSAPVTTGECLCLQCPP